MVTNTFNSTPPIRRFLFGVLAISSVYFIAVFGYIVADMDPIDAFYMASMILTTVGLGEVYQFEPGLKAFTIVVMLFGVSAVFYFAGGLIQMVTEGEINRALGLKRASREIENLKGHIIVCGYGRMGEILATQLSRYNRTFVVIDRDHERIEAAGDLGYYAILGDATEEEPLSRAGVENASILVTTLPRDADNVFITLTSRGLNKEMLIIARGELESTEKKLIQAGANRVVLPAATGALRMAAMVTNPSALELIEIASGRQIADVQLDELIVGEECLLVGQSLSESQTRSKYGILVVATRDSDGLIAMNPDADTVIAASSSLIVIGKPEDIECFQQENKLIRWVI